VMIDAIIERGNDRKRLIVIHATQS
jgi:hypothetical protein